jgi:hypothetical protein
MYLHLDRFDRDFQGINALQLCQVREGRGGVGGTLRVPLKERIPLVDLLDLLLDASHSLLDHLPHKEIKIRDCIHGRVLRMKRRER